MSKNDEGLNLAHRAIGFAGWATRTGYSFTRQLPGMDTAERGIRWVEHHLLGGPRRRLDEVDDPYRAALTVASAMDRGSTNGPTPGYESGAGRSVPNAEPLRAAMGKLLNRSTDFGRERAREYLYAIILSQLTPDEARILSTMSGGASFPLIDVVERTGLGGTGRVVLRNASTVGKTVGVSDVEQVPAYITRLIAFGLADRGGEGPAMETQYEILMTDETVRAAESSVRRAKLIRRTVRLSRFGVRFWEACNPVAY